MFDFLCVFFFFCELGRTIIFLGPEGVALCILIYIPLFKLCVAGDFGGLAGAGMSAGPGVPSLCHVGVALSGAGVGLGQGSLEVHHTWGSLGGGTTGAGVGQGSVVYWGGPRKLHRVPETFSFPHYHNVGGIFKKWYSEVLPILESIPAISHTFGKHSQISKYMSFTYHLFVF